MPAAILAAEANRLDLRPVTGDQAPDSLSLGATPTPSAMGESIADHDREAVADHWGTAVRALYLVVERGVRVAPADFVAWSTRRRLTHTSSLTVRNQICVPPPA